MRRGGSRSCWKRCSVLSPHKVVAASWDGHRKGTVVTVDEAQAASLVRLGVLKPVRTKKQKKE